LIILWSLVEVVVDIPQVIPPAAVVQVVLELVLDFL
jgi:hypothetical protein